MASTRLSAPHLLLNWASVHTPAMVAGSTHAIFGLSQQGRCLSVSDRYRYLAVATPSMNTTEPNTSRFPFNSGRGHLLFQGEMR